MNIRLVKFFLLLTALPLFSKEHACPNISSWEMEYSSTPSISANITEVENNNTFKLEGNVYILSASNIIQANEANVTRNGNEYSGFVKAGSLNSELFRLTFESLNIQNSGEELSAINGTLQRNQSPLELTFGTLNREANLFKMETVVMSSCSNNPGGWKINGSDVIVNDSGRGSISDMELEVFGRSVLWLPWVPFPATTDRLSGFLEPKIQFGSEGLDVSLPYFLILSPASDITFAPRNLADRGKGFESNFRYKSSIIDIEIDGLFLDKDKKLKGLDALDNNRWAGATRAHGGIAGFSYNINWAKASDFLVLQNIPTFVSNIDINRSPYLLQNASLEYRNNNLDLTIRSEDAQLLDPVASKSVAKKPEIEINYADTWNNVGFSLQAIRSKFHLPQQFIQTSGFQANSSSLTRDYLKTEFNVMHYFKEWSVQAAYTHTSREYDVQDTLSPKNTNIGSAYLHASSFLKNQNSNSALKPFLLIKYTPYEDYGNILLLDDRVKNTFAYDMLSNPVFSGKDITLDERSLTAGFEFLFNKASTQLQGMLGIKKNYEDSKVLNKFFTNFQLPAEQLLLDATLMHNNTFIQLVLDYDFNQSEVQHGQIAFQQSIGGSTFKIAQHKQNVGSGLFLEEVDFREFSIIFDLGNNYQAFIYNSEDTITNKNMDSYIGIGYENCCVAWRILARDKRLIDLNLMQADAQLIAQESWKEMISYENKSRITFEIELKGLMSPSKRIQRLLQNFQE
jgi:LPS-assembly protein